LYAIIRNATKQRAITIVLRFSIYDNDEDEEQNRRITRTQDRTMVFPGNNDENRYNGICKNDGGPINRATRAPRVSAQLQ